VDISFKREGKIVVARLRANEGYAAREIDWRLDWRLRFQISVTPTGRGYGLGQPLALAGGRFGTNSQDVTVAVNGDTVVVEFVLPDCLHVLQGGSWGCSAGAAIPLPSGKHHCQALMYARTPGMDSVLRRTTEGIEFCDSRLGRVTPIALLNWTPRPVPPVQQEEQPARQPGPRLVKATGARPRKGRR
jgi:hypothetical protein